MAIIHSTQPFLTCCGVTDLRDPSTIPLNFTKSINLALSERGINAMKHTNRDQMIQKILGEAIPVHGRMIHGRDDGKLWEAAQAYDVHGRVCDILPACLILRALSNRIVAHQFIGQRHLEQRSPGRAGTNPQCQALFQP